MTMHIGNTAIGYDQPPFIIAEISGNHNQSIDRAFKIVEAAKKAGVHAVKLQTYTADTMTLDVSKGSFSINDEESLWNGRNLYELYDEAHTPWEWHKELFDRCKELGLLCFSTPFDASSVEFLEKLKAPAYKIASPEILDIPLIQKVARTGKPVIMSTGMANIQEIAEAVQAAKNAGCKDLVLLKCTSAYPASPKDSNLATIPHMKDLFGVQVGISDHTPGIGVPLAAIALGAIMVEKHITLKRSDGGVDAAFSLEPHEFSRLVSESARVRDAIGKINYGPVKNEKGAIKFRRSLYFVKDLQKGDVITKDHIRSLRPGDGISPKYFDIVMGKKVNCDIKIGDPVLWNRF